MTYAELFNLSLVVHLLIATISSTLRQSFPESTMCCLQPQMTLREKKLSRFFISLSDLLYHSGRFRNCLRLPQLLSSHFPGGAKFLTNEPYDFLWLSFTLQFFIVIHRRHITLSLIPFCVSCCSFSYSPCLLQSDPATCHVRGDYQGDHV